MTPATRRRTTWGIAASALAHVALLGIVLSQRPALLPPIPDFAGPPQTVIPLLIQPRSRSVAAAGGAAQPSDLRLHRPTPTTEPSSLAPRFAPGPKPAVETPPSAALAAQGQPAPDLRAALRHGALGCANLAATGMTRAERDACDDQLGRGAGQAPVLALAMEPRIRAYYDAVAKAKAPDRPPSPARAPGALGMFDEDDRGQTGHPPAIGCAIPFGPGEKPKLPAHWLKLGPCFMAPPKGPLTVEADITPP